MIASRTAGPTLTDARGKGGTIAQDGFDFQLWDGLTRLPVWLRNPAFEGLMFEGLEDLEARFFAPHAPHRHLLDRFQAKSGEFTRSTLLAVVESFMAFDAAHPQAARVHTLVTPGLPTRLAWIASDPGRVRRARPFYAPFSDICASDGKLREDLIREFGPKIGEFLAHAVSAAVSRLGAKQIDLFLAGSAAFAVALGHRWNALPPTQLYEFLPAERRYVPTIQLG